MWNYYYPFPSCRKYRKNSFVSEMKSLEFQSFDPSIRADINFNFSPRFSKRSEFTEFSGFFCSPVFSGEESKTVETVPLSLLYRASRGAEMGKRAMLLEASLSERDLVSGKNWGKHIFETRIFERKVEHVFSPLNFPIFTSKLDILNLK